MPTRLKIEGQATLLEARSRGGLAQMIMQRTICRDVTTESVHAHGFGRSKDAIRSWASERHGAGDGRAVARVTEADLSHQFVPIFINGQTIAATALRKTGLAIRAVAVVNRIRRR